MMMPAVIAVLSARDAFDNDAAYLAFAEGKPDHPLQQSNPNFNPNSS